MIIRCPECSTRYLLPDSKIPAAGRKVRCAKCSAVWHQDPAVPEPSADTPPPKPPVSEPPVSEAPAPEPPRPEPEDDRSERGGRQLSGLGAFPDESEPPREPPRQRFERDRFGPEPQEQDSVKPDTSAPVAYSKPGAEEPASETPSSEEPDQPATPFGGEEEAAGREAAQEDEEFDSSLWGEDEPNEGQEETRSRGFADAEEVSPADETEEEAGEEDLFAPPPKLDESRLPAVQEERSLGGRIGGILVIVVALVVLIIGGLLLARDTVEGTVPASDGFYNLIDRITGDDLPPGGQSRMDEEAAQSNVASSSTDERPAPAVGTPLTLMVTESKIEDLNGFRVLLVKGMIENPTQREQPVPQIKAEILDQRGNLLNEWKFTPSFTSLPAGTSEDFNAQLSNPPSGIRSVQFDFDLAEAGGGG